jgi:hypothetical protein
VRLRTLQLLLNGATSVLRRSMRICEECGTERRITLLEQAVTTHDGKTVIGLFGEGRCLCPSYALDALDLEALDNTLKETAGNEGSDDLDLESAESLSWPPELEEAPRPDKTKKPRPRT